MESGSKKSLLPGSLIRVQPFLPKPAFAEDFLKQRLKSL